MGIPYDLSPATADVIGSGLRAPFAFSQARSVRTVATTNGIEKIQASMRDILMTRPGERVMSPEYGSRIFDLVFEAGDFPTHSLLYLYTVEALNRWERRIRVTSVTFLDDEQKPNYIGIAINFEILQTHQMGSYVFPYEKRGMAMTTMVTGSESRRIFAQGQVAPPEASNVFGGSFSQSR